MQKILFFILFTTLVFTLTQCTNNSNKQVSGNWKLMLINMNGTELQVQQLDNWNWTFNDAGTYKINNGGNIDKGTFTTTNQTLVLKSDAAEKIPAQTYTILQLDSVKLVLSSKTNDNKSDFYFQKQ